MQGWCEGAESSLPHAACHTCDECDMYLQIDAMLLKLMQLRAQHVHMKQQGRSTRAAMQSTKSAGLQLGQLPA